MYTEFREKTCLLKTTVNFCQWTQCPVNNFLSVFVVLFLGFCVSQH